MTKAQKPAEDLTASLDAYADSVRAERATAYWYTLPEEVRATIEASGHATHTIVRWLHTIGYEDATYSKIEHYRKATRKPTEG